MSHMLLVHISAMKTINIQKLASKEIETVINGSNFAETLALKLIVYRQVTTDLINIRSILMFMQMRRRPCRLLNISSVYTRRPNMINILYSAFMEMDKMWFLTNFTTAKLTLIDYNIIHTFMLLVQVV